MRAILGAQAHAQRHSTGFAPARCTLRKCMHDHNTANCHWRMLCLQLLHHSLCFDCKGQSCCVAHAEPVDSHSNGASVGCSPPRNASHPAPCPKAHKQPYQIELVGVTCSPTLAVARGFWRKLRSGRGVPVSAQLRSHRLFARNWCTYCKLLDSATLYHTGAYSSCANLFICADCTFIAGMSGVFAIVRRHVDSMHA